MARALSGTLTTAVSQTVTKPFYCLYLAFPGAALRYSSRGLVTIDGDIYSDSSMQVSLSGNASGSSAATVTLASIDGVLRQLVLQNNIDRIVAKLYAVYGNSSYTYADDTLLLLDGYIAAVPRIDDYVEFTLVSRSAERRFPPIVLGPPHNNHIPPAGSKITLQNETELPPAPNPNPTPGAPRPSPPIPPRPNPQPTQPGRGTVTGVSR